jgi:predicted ATPase
MNKPQINHLPHETRKALASKLIEHNFENRQMESLADWLNHETHNSFTVDQVRWFSKNLRQAILKPHACKDAGLIAICRQLQVV